MQIPMSKLGLVDIDTKNVPRKAWIIVAWAIFILSVGAAVSIARRGSVTISYSTHAAEAAAASYTEDLK